ncbi:hypothetical protein BDF14DRAFT_1719723 [Spinellus fusiger]|nr:hypothetical protein BDF14DRAFT_1719723 [Spinellus fusiger]
MKHTLPDSWLELLGDHAIFKKESRDTQKSLIKSTHTHTHTPIHTAKNTSLRHLQHIVVTPANDLIVAVEDEIRGINLNQVKEAWLEETRQTLEGKTDTTWLCQIPYRVLDTPDITFNIESLTLNHNGRLLAVADQHHLAVVSLPREGFGTETGISKNIHTKQRLNCRTMRVGELYWRDNETQVLKVVWHPLSELHAHLLVLSTDNLLRMFNISKDIEEPEQCFDLSPGRRKKSTKVARGIRFDDDLGPEEDTVSFSLGTSGNEDGWESFTVYYAQRNGHVYALCPVLPSTSVIKRRHLETLASVANVKIRKIEEEGPLDQLEDDRQCLYYTQRLHYQWIYDMLLSTGTERKETPTFVDRDLVIVETTKCSIPYDIQRQGPFKVEGIMGDPFDISDEQVSDIAFLKTGAVDVLAIACTNGTVCNYLLGVGIDPQWLMPSAHDPDRPWQSKLGLFLSQADTLPRMSLYEQLEIVRPSSTQSQMSIVVDPVYADTYYIYHTAGVHIIVMTEWVNTLAKIKDAYLEEKGNEEIEDTMAAWVDNKSQSITRCLVNSSPYDRETVPVSGLAILTDVYLSRSLFVLSSTSSLVTVAIGDRNELTIEKGSGLSKAIETQLKDAAKEGRNIEAQYQCDLSLPPFSVPKALQSFQQLPNQPKVIVPPTLGGNKEIVITEESLKFFNTHADKIQKDVQTISTCVAEIGKRLFIQHKELRQQVETVKDLQEEMTLLSAGLVNTRDNRLKEATHNFVKLALRTEAILAKHLKSYRPVRSDEENQLLHQLKEDKKTVNGKHGYLARTEKVRKRGREREQ